MNKTLGLSITALLLYVGIMIAISPWVHQPGLDGPSGACRNESHKHVGMQLGNNTVHEDLSMVASLVLEDRYEKESIENAVMYMYTSFPHLHTKEEWHRIVVSIAKKQAQQQKQAVETQPKEKKGRKG